jgi:hypothetical protein
MPKWLSLGRHTGPQDHATLPIVGNLADYPPGTPLPPLENPDFSSSDFSSLSPRQRRRLEKKWPKLAAMRQEALERLRDDYFRNRGTGAD